MNIYLWRCDMCDTIFAPDDLHETEIKRYAESGPRACAFTFTDRNSFPTLQKCTGHVHPYAQLAAEPLVIERI